METRRAELNTSDPVNGDHGDHMAAIFQLAAEAAENHRSEDMATAMEAASQLLLRQTDNSSARVYGRGLAQFARQFREKDIQLPELTAYLENVTEEDKAIRDAASPPRSGEVLKALVSGLSAWKQAEAANEAGGSEFPGGLDMGALFELGAAYMQAKSRGGTRLEILADAAATASPLNEPSYRRNSARLAFLKLLQAMTGRL